jgi:hypothetical protein
LVLVIQNKIVKIYKTQIIIGDIIMSFQAYLDNIKTKTGKTPEDFKRQLQKENYWILISKHLIRNYMKKTTGTWTFDGTWAALNQKVGYLNQKEEVTESIN